MSELKIGDKAPEFRLPSDGGADISTTALKGHKVILYFYPKDNTPGCTTQACGFRDNQDALNNLNAKVVGISKDSVKKHDNFKAKHGLNFPLASDEQGDVCERYGVWKEKSMYGKTFMGIERTTFLIDEDGVITQIWRKVKVNDHMDEIRAALKAHNSVGGS